MKSIKIILSTLLIFSATTIFAQENSEMTSETVEKTYEVYENGELIKNSVKINTVISRDVLMEPEDKSKVNQDRIFQKKNVMKTVKIDSDSDNAYDEIIKFSYRADIKSDFMLVTNDDEIMVAIDNGNKLEIVKSESIYKNKLKSNKEAYVITDDKGNEIELFIEDYTSMK
ncbi:hypothetical protein [Sediminicola arcticus]|uniref:Uncharacterized protein n=1 Tax=Sediminicola arcticus TaxID=1574308 RepID=A0ABV2STQ8_9FLAO